jgi:hypothetical protein
MLEVSFMGGPKTYTGTYEQELLYQSASTLDISSETF